MMHLKSMFYALKLSGLCVLGTLLGDVAAHVPQISGEWTIDIKTTVAVGSVVIVGAWRVASYMQKLEDKIEGLTARISVMERKLEKLSKQYTDEHQE